MQPQCILFLRNILTSVIAIMYIVVFLVLLSRILDLENESGDLADTKMVVTVFQFLAYFLEEVQ